MPAPLITPLTISSTQSLHLVRPSIRVSTYSLNASFQPSGPSPSLGMLAPYLTHLARYGTRLLASNNPH